MKKSELKILIKESLNEGGFLDSIMTLVNPAGAAKSLTSASVKSPKYQKAISDLIDFYMDRILSTDNIKSKTNIQLVNMILKRFYATVSDALREKYKLDKFELFKSRFNKIYNIKSYELGDMFFEKRNGKQISIGQKIKELEQAISINNKTIEDKRNSDPSKAKETERKNQKNINNYNKLKSHFEKTIQEDSNRFKEDLLRFLKTGE